MSDNLYSRMGNDRAVLVEMLQAARGERGARPRHGLRHIDCLWLNGELIPLDEAEAHILEPALPEGDGIFEGIGCYETARGPALFRPEAHLARFLERARQLGVHDLRYDLFALRRAAHVTVQVNNFSSCYVRPILYFVRNGEGAGGQGLEPAVAVTASGWDSDVAREAWSDEKRGQGIQVMVSARDGRPGHPETGAEAEAAARKAARSAGFDEALLLDEHGLVAGCTVESVFLLRDGVLYTPPQPEALRGVARDTVTTLAGDLGYEVWEAPIKREQLYAAEEMFVCSTTAEVTPVREIDGRQVNGGEMGPLTARLQVLYADAVRGRGPRSRGWLEYVMMEPLF